MIRPKEQRRRAGSSGPWTRRARMNHPKWILLVFSLALGLAILGGCSGNSGTSLKATTSSPTGQSASPTASPTGTPSPSPSGDVSAVFVPLADYSYVDLP